MQESRLYTFLDPTKRFSVYFLEGQKAIGDLATTHHLNTNALMYHRDTLLSSLHLTTFLKVGDTAGFYIDAQEPYFRFKMEIAQNGDFRTLILPAELSEPPTTIDGVCRITKISHGHEPYTSVIKLENEAAKDVVNLMFSQSYQQKSKIILAPTVDQSIMITHLPALNIKEVSAAQGEGLEQFIKRNNKSFQQIFTQVSDDFQEIVASFEKLGLTYIHSKQVTLKCSCSKEHLAQAMGRLPESELKEIFLEKNPTDVRCDYCNTTYQIGSSDVLPPK